MSVLLIYVDIGIITKNAKHIIHLEFIEKSTLRETWPPAAMASAWRLRYKKSQHTNSFHKKIVKSFAGYAFQAFY
jgi:hypothetical protein